ncbi:hypothetical protein C3L33_17268, partial [Rhododendron williamsianum]
QTTYSSSQEVLQNNMGYMPAITLGQTCVMPVIGMGTATYPPADVETAKNAIVEAIRAGYRHFDTAFAYRSEQPLGEAIAEALRLGLIKSRDELFITTKLWCSFGHRDQVVPAIKLSLQNLQLEYVDLYLIHWPIRLTQHINSTPVPKDHIVPMDIKSVWEGMEECQKLGFTKAIGVSNFSCRKLDELLSVAQIPPAVNQVYILLYITDPDYKFHHLCGDEPSLESKATEGVSLRWVYEQGVSIVTKSFNKRRMRENLGIFDWSLTEEESNKINQLPQRKGVTMASILGPHDLVLEIDAEI